MRENSYVPQEGEISQEITPLARQVPQQQWREPLPVLRLVQSYHQAVLLARGLYRISLVKIETIYHRIKSKSLAAGIVANVTLRAN